MVLVAGEGTRLRPLTFTTPKPMVPVLGKPVVQYAVEALRDSGVTKICMVVGHLGHVFRQYFGDGSRLGVEVRYVEQRERLGIAHAIHRAIEEGCVDGPMVVHLGDNVFGEPITPIVRGFLESGEDAHIVLTRHRDPTRFGYVIISDGRPVRLIEKPRDPPPGGYTLTGLYMFRDSDVVERAFRALKPSQRGEYEITDLIQRLIDSGHRVGYTVIGGWWKDTGTPSDLIELAALMLDRVEPRIEGEVAGEVRGRVVVERGAVVEGVVHGPAYIGRGAYVGRSASLEHYVDLEEGASAVSGSLSRTLVLEGARVEAGAARLVDSVIGRYAEVRLRRGTYRLVLGDYSVVESVSGAQLA